MADQSRPGVRLSRSSVAAQVRVRVPGRHWASEVIDLSASGALVRQPEDFDLPEDSLAALELYCADVGSLRVQARVVRVASRTVAFLFEGLGPSQARELRTLMDSQRAEAKLRGDAEASPD